MEALEKCKEAEKYCLQLILELLEASGLVETAEALRGEAEMSPVGKRRPRVGKEAVPAILANLNNMEAQTFFQNWTSLVPKEIQEEAEYRKLTAYLHVYFATLGFRSLEKDTELNQDQGMTLLKDFLAERGSELSSHQEFLPYFALPYVSKPTEHPTFSQIFKEGWAKDLERRVESFLVEWSCGSAVQPELVRLVERQDLGPKYRDLRRRFNRLRRDHHNVVGVASELATALENSVRGEAVDLRATLDNCINIFPDLFSSQQRGEYSRAAQVMYSELDGGRIKTDLREADPQTKLSLLRAIRRTTFVQWLRRGDREGVVGWLRRGDLLGLGDWAVEEGVLGHRGGAVGTELARLLDMLATCRTGRDYLAEHHPSLVAALVRPLISHLPTPNDPLLPALQKLSLRREPCLAMLEGGLLGWLLDSLHSLDQHSLEYGSALLMNLLLHADPSHYDPPRLVSLLLPFIETLPDNSVLEFVLGAVYCTLGGLWEEWRESRLEEVLRGRLGGAGVTEGEGEGKEAEDSKRMILEESGGGDQRGEQGQRLGEESRQRVATLLALLHQQLPLSAITLITDDQLEDILEDPEEVEAEVGDEEETVLHQYKLVFPPRGVVWKRGGVEIRPATPRPIQGSFQKVTLISPKSSR